jgi:hypothetical protein
VGQPVQQPRLAGGVPEHHEGNEHHNFLFIMNINNLFTYMFIIYCYFIYNEHI